jgi:alpha-tubulin suppressor-like RCC1 family protein
MYDVTNYPSAQERIPPISITVGNNHKCAIMENGKLICWGDNTHGQIASIQNEPTVDLGTGRTAIAVDAGSDHTCAILDDQSIKCWGSNSNGQLGDETTVDRMWPAAVDLGTGRTAIDVAAGDDFTCAILDNGKIKCWGSNRYGQIGPNVGTALNSNYLNPISFSTGERTATSITAGGSFACAILDDGSTICWGDNTKGQLGDRTVCRVGTYDYSNGCNGAGGKSEPTVVQLGSNERIVAISAGSLHTCATLYSGIVECWGNNENGQLGDGTRITRSSSAPVKFVSISTGEHHSCAITPGGEGVRNLKCWGRANNGQLGIEFNSFIGPDCDGRMYYGTIPRSLAPSTVCLPTYNFGALGGTSVVAVATGAAHTCALTDVGLVKCWGNNWYGQLGLMSGGPDGRLSPSQSHIANEDGYVWLGGEEDDWDFVGNIIAVDISAGAYHTCATLVDDSVKCWGRNDRGQLGDGTRCRIGSNPQSFQTSHLYDTGYDQTTDGCNGRGGKDIPSLVDLPTDSVTTDYGMISVTTEVPQGKVLAIDGGLQHTCAILDSGADSNPVSIRCWGSNSRGQLGCGPMCGDQLSPIPVELASDNLLLFGSERKSLIDIDVGRYHSCAILDDGTTQCWGKNSAGQLGRGFTGVWYSWGAVEWTPDDVVTTHEMTLVRGGGEHTCGVDTDGNLQCWGKNSWGQLGDGSEVGRITPVNVDGLSRDKVIDMDLGYGHTCAVLSNSYSGIGTIKCWGMNHYSQLGDGTECANIHSDPCKSTTNIIKNQPVEVQFELFSMITDTSGTMVDDGVSSPGTVEPVPELPPGPPPGTGSEYPPCGSIIDLAPDVGNGMSIGVICNAQQGNNGGSNSTSSNGSGNQTGCPDGTTMFEYESLLLCVSDEIDPNMLKDEELLKNATFLAPEVVEEGGTSNTQNTGGLESNFFTVTGMVLLGLMLLLIGMYNNRKKKDDDFL